MKKRTLPIFLLVLIFVMSVSVFTACNPDPPQQSGLPEGITVGAGDNIFTEDATLEQLSAALENANSFTVDRKYNVKYSEDGVEVETDVHVIKCYNKADKTLMVHDSEYANLHTPAALVDDAYFFFNEDMFYRVDFTNFRVVEEDNNERYEMNPDGKMEFESAQKSVTPFYEYESASEEIHSILSGLVMKDGKLALTDDEDAYFGGEVKNRKLELKGTEIVITYTTVDYSDDGSIYATFDWYFCIKGVNATKIDISEEMKSYCEQAEFDEF